MVKGYTADAASALRERLEQPAPQPEQDVPEASCGDMVPAGWLESPDGAFRANPLYKIQFPSSLLSWQVPLYMALPEQEPVARVIDNGTPEGATEWIPFTNRVEPLNTGDLLYTAAPQRKPLSDDELSDIWYKQSTDWMEFARAIEAAHGIKENT